MPSSTILPISLCFSQLSPSNLRQESKLLKRAGSIILVSLLFHLIGFSFRLSLWSLGDPVLFQGTSKSLYHSVFGAYLLRFKAPLQFKNYIPTESMIEQVLQPHIFTYFTTDGYTGGGTKIGGYNQDVGGWVQVDSTYFPGSAFSSISTFGGTQYDMTMQYQLYQGNWWLYVIDR